MGEPGKDVKLDRCLETGATGVYRREAASDRATTIADIEVSFILLLCKCDLHLIAAIETF